MVLFSYVVWEYQLIRLVDDMSAKIQEMLGLFAPAKAIE